MTILTPKFKRISVQQRYERLLAALAIKPMTAEELAAPLFSAKSTVIVMLRRLREEPVREIRVARWKRARTGLHRVWGLGSEPDAPKPKKRTASEQYKHIRSQPAKVEHRRLQLIAKQRKLRAQKFPTLVSDVLQYVEWMRTISTPEIAKHLGISSRTAIGALKELEDGKKIMRQVGTIPIVWAPYAERAAEPKDLVQVTKKKWTAPRVRPQSIFAALGWNP